MFDQQNSVCVRGRTRGQCLNLARYWNEAGGRQMVLIDHGVTVPSLNNCSRLELSRIKRCNYQYKHILFLALINVIQKTVTTIFSNRLQLSL